MTAQLALRLRDAALDRLETDKKALIAYVRTELVRLYREREQVHGSLDAFVTADDARRICERLSDTGVRLPKSANWRGTLFRKGWKAVGMHVSVAPQGHGNRVFRYRYVGAK